MKAQQHTNEKSESSHLSCRAVITNNQMRAIMNLDLHYCTIEEVNYHWQSTAVKISVWRYYPDRQRSILNCLELSGVTELFIPHENS